MVGTIPLPSVLDYTGYIKVYADCDVVIFFSLALEANPDLDDRYQRIVKSVEALPSILGQQPKVIEGVIQEAWQYCGQRSAYNKYSISTSKLVLPWLLVVLALSTVSPTVAAATGSVLIEKGEVAHNVGPAIEYFRDASNSLRLTDVQQLPFQEHGNSNLNFGFTTDSVWLRFNLEPKIGSAKEWVLEVNHPLLDRVELFSRQGNKSWQTQLAGVVVDRQLRELDLRAVAFSISLQADQIQTFYLRIDSGSSIVAPVRLVEKNTYFNSTAAIESGLG